MQPNFLRCMFDAMARSPVFSFAHSAQLPAWKEVSGGKTIGGSYTYRFSRPEDEDSSVHRDLGSDS
jgi:hypothetical protein